MKVKCTFLFLVGILFPFTVHQNLRLANCYTVYMSCINTFYQVTDEVAKGDTTAEAGRNGGGDIGGEAGMDGIDGERKT